MVQTFRNAWKIPELRRKILFTLFIVLLYRLGNAVPVPYVDTNILATYFAQLKNTVLGLYNTMSGGAFSMATIFALSIQPYINASIIIQLLCIAIPALERLSKEGGEEGKKKIAAITRYSTVGIGLLTQLTASVCADAGESTVTRLIELCGSVLGIYTALPLLEAVLSLLRTMLEG